MKSEVFRKIPKSSENVRSPSPSINANSPPVLFTSKIRDREEGIVIYSFYTWFPFLTWVWVDIFLEIVSSKTARTHIFQSGVRNWSAGVSRRDIEVFNPQAWDSRLRRESWQVYKTALNLHNVSIKLLRIRSGFVLFCLSFVPSRYTTYMLLMHVTMQLVVFSVYFQLTNSDAMRKSSPHITTDISC